jgi:hypothetical protein
MRKYLALAMLLFAIGIGCLMIQAPHAQMLLLGVGPGSSGGGGGGGTSSFTASGPIGGVQSVASTNFTVTLNTGTFNGVKTITIADGSQGGTITPSVGGAGTSTVVVTPASGSSFTFTYTPAVAATVTLTFTNAQGWSNATALTYTSTTFDPVNIGGGFALSNNNLTATMTSGGGGGYNLVRSLTSQASSKFYSEYTITSLVGSTDSAFGTAGSSASAAAGFDANLSGAMFDTSSGYFTNSASLGATPSVAVGQVVGVAIDTGGKLIWLTNATTAPTVWNAGGTANPATGVGGYSIANITGPYFAEAWVNHAAVGTTVITANFGASAYTGTAPVGFGKW